MNTKTQQPNIITETARAIKTGWIGATLFIIWFCGMLGIVEAIA